LIADLPVGNYSLRFSHIGYQSLLKADVIVRPGRIVSVKTALKMAAIPGKGIRVTSSYFPLQDRHPTSSLSFSAPEIRRSPGISTDVSRVVGSLPSVSRYDDRFNNMAVRGGNPIENGYIVDGIEVHSINHYMAPGSSGGVVGLLNVDLIQELSFHTGGFPAEYGDRLSSFMSIVTREGNRQEFDGQVALDVSGTGLTVEGPLAKGKGSWLVSGRKGFLDLLMDILQTDIAPRHWDFHARLDYDVSPNSRLTVTGLGGSSSVVISRKIADVIGTDYYGDVHTSEWAAGLKWRCLWNTRGYSDVSAVFSRTVYRYNSIWAKTDLAHYTDDSRDRSLLLRNTNRYRFSESFRIDFGLVFKRALSDLDYYYGPWTDPLGYRWPSLSIARKESNNKIGVFVSAVIQVFDRLAVTPGIRSDYYSYNGNHNVSPRLSFSWEIGRRTSVNGATGIYYQNLPLMILVQDSTSVDLGDPYAYHVILGVSHLLAEDVRLTLEVYDKEYRDFPMDKKQAPLFIIDELIEYYGFPLGHKNLSGGGKAYSRGIEAVLQKKLSRKYYGLIGASFFRARYRDYEGAWHNRVTDNVVVALAEGGYRPNEKWEFSLRWEFAGGRPYTPFDTALSREYDQGLYDLERIGAARTPVYHSLSLRVDRRFNFRRSNLAVFFSIWNLYDRKNVAGYYYDGVLREKKPMYQMSILPIFGLEYEF
ncbi:MAG: TonB-dependent receptor, partial [Candidatus Zixiibacteriota bacterium]